MVVLQAPELVQALEAVAAKLGVAVRYEAIEAGARGRPGRARGGLVRLRGKPIILIDEKLGPRERIGVLAQALASFDLDGIYLPPLVRVTIRSHGSTHVLEPRPLARAKPGRRNGED